jgi:hypothetical protein
MDVVIDPPGHARGVPSAEKRVRAFRATDHFALAVWQAVRAFGKPEGESLAREIRRSVARSGGALVAVNSQGQVMWITPEGVQGNRTQGIGVQFTQDETGSAARATIEKILGETLGSTRPTHTM